MASHTAQGVHWRVCAPGLDVNFDPDVIPAEAPRTLTDDEARATIAELASHLQAAGQYLQDVGQWLRDHGHFPQADLAKTQGDLACQRAAGWVV